MIDHGGTDHYSSRSVRLSSDTTNIGSNERKILIENDYEVTYGTYFKIVRMKCGFDHAVKNPGKCTKNTYVLRKRGTDVPTIDPNTNEMIESMSEDGTETRHFEIPATSIAVGGTFALAYLEALDVDTDTLKLIDSQYMHSPCMQLAVQNGEIIDHAYAVYGADWSVDTTAWSAKCDELNVDLTFTDEYGTGKCGNREAVNVLFHGNADDTAILRAEWLKFVSLFFDKEQFANEYFALESDAVEAIKTYVEKGIVASLSEKKTCVWVQKMGSFYEILHDTFRTSLCVDAGMLAYQGEAGVLKKAFAIDTQHGSVSFSHSRLRRGRGRELLLRRFLVKSLCLRKQLGVRPTLWPNGQSERRQRRFALTGGRFARQRHDGRSQRIRRSSTGVVVERSRDQRVRWNVVQRRRVSEILSKCGRECDLRDARKLRGVGECR